MKNKYFKKTSVAVLAAAMAATCIPFSGAFISSGADETIKYEFENGTLVDAIVPGADSERYRAGASGDKFVFLENANETASVTVTVESAGMYNLTLCYGSPYGNKIHNYLVNGVDQGEFSCAKTGDDEWVELSLGAVKLNAGENEITIKSSWGWTNLDYLTVAPAKLSPISASQTSCCDAKATKETQNLMSYLASVYGKHVISGQQEIYQYGPHDFEYEFNYIKDLTGELPAVRGFDFLNCANILYGSDDGSTDRIIDWVKNKNGIATASWHLTVPKNFKDYNLGDKISWNDATYSVWQDNDKTIPWTDFVTSNVLVEGTKEYDYYQLCLKSLAETIGKLQDANVPLIFRPLHEAEGGGGETGSWFWWGKEGSAVYKDIWKLTYKTLTEDYGLHNIIWEWNSYPYDTSANWYPGDEYVDIVAYDKYNCTKYDNNGNPSLEHNDSAISSTFYNIMEKYSSKKMVAMAENDSIPTLSNLLEEKAGWLYFCPWYDGGDPNTNFLTNEIFNRKEDLIEMYQSDYCITLDELPADLYSETSEVPTPAPTEPPTPAPTTEDSTETTTEEPTFELKKYDITPESFEGTGLIFTIKGEPGAYTNGCFGFAVGKEWISQEWETTIGADGTSQVTIDFGKLPEEIPADLKSAEVQIWWSAVYDEATDTNIITDAEMTEYAIGEIDTAPLYGDANLDGKLSISDAVQILSYASNQEKCPLEDPDICDVYNRGDGVDGLDSLSVQKKITNIISELPESYLNN